MDNNVNEEVDINQLMKVRREKLEELRNFVNSICINSH